MGKIISVDLSTDNMLNRNIFVWKVVWGNDYTISGYVTDTKSEQSLIGANIYIEGTSK